MLFTIGTKVRFKHSSDEGTVTGLLDQDMVNVLLKGDGFEIPVFIEDIVPVTDPVPVKQLSPKTAPKAPTPNPQQPPIESQYAILKSAGLQLAFDPVLDREGQAKQFKVFLINDTRYDLIYTTELWLNDYIHMQQSSKLNKMSWVELGVLLYDQLNDNPVFEIDCWCITTEGTGGKMHKTLRIKPKVFFKKTLTAPLLNRPVHLFKLIENVLTTLEPKAEDLKTYTKKKTNTPGTSDSWSDILGRLSHEVLDLSEFVPEIDLHIENLVADHSKMSNAEILRVQLSHFERYLEKAIRLGVERVFIIHGVGKGRLREAIATQLRRMPEVSAFRNEYHHKYGYGATEVIF
ncbi:MAG TPA: Smr/MutS family protein [Saprospiraceae bacterium]|nr:Smr/MutS family protein [Saprospiraceae bacterium]HMQ85072.1 Smr/MutS family protein [Saprospiraceae bacterium]